MSAYHQMGHDSWNLVREADLQDFKGVILSPVNDSPDETETKLRELRELGKDLDVVLDPQLYKPDSDRGRLPTWPHFVSGYETANLSDRDWWQARCESLVKEAERLVANSICSPSVIPRDYSDEYYDWVINLAELLSKVAHSSSCSIRITAVVRLQDLAISGRAQRIASVLTRSDISNIYLVFNDEIQPRQQRVDIEALSGAITLIKTLKSAGSQVLVAFSGLDLLLWKYAGATDVATGKFFNLRRFTPGRFDDPKERGSVVPYWTDENFITWLREAEVRLLINGNMIAKNQHRNPYSSQILRTIQSNSGGTWVGLGWRQYMWWFADVERMLDASPQTSRALLQNADRKWQELEKSGVLLFDRDNNGDWIRAWLNSML